MKSRGHIPSLGRFPRYSLVSDTSAIFGRFRRARREGDERGQVRMMRYKGRLNDEMPAVGRRRRCGTTMDGNREVEKQGSNKIIEREENR